MTERELIGRHIAQARKSRNLKQVELGSAIGVSDQTISNWEVGLRIPRADYILRMCEVLECSADELLGIPSTVERATDPTPPHRTGLEEDVRASTPSPSL